jgi:hypothetical protein
MVNRALPFVIVTLLSASTQPQVVWQPAPAPMVTAEAAAWYRSGEPVEWNGDKYYPAGAVQFFNRYQMIRSGSFRGIPLYTDTTLEPNSIVFVPLTGERMQPYERSQATQASGLNQAPAEPTRAPAYDLSPTPVLAAPQPTDALPAAPLAVGTSGRGVATPVRHVATLRPPTGLNAIWVDYGGRRWLAGGKAIDYDAASLTQVGTYRGWSVYTRHGDRSTIYIPVAPGRLAPYKGK